MPTVTPPRPRAVVVGVQLPDVSDAEHASSLAELRRLAHTLGFDVIGEITQKRSTLAPGAVLGEGKLRELARWTGGSGVIPSGVPAHRQRSQSSDDDEEGDVLEPLPVDERAMLVLVDHEIGPSQARNLERATGAEVMDRTAVILAIFQRHARTREAALQVELARLAYIAPRLRETGGGADRQGGGIGAKGAGETKHELDKRRIRDRMAELRHELVSIEKGAEHRRSRRATHPTVAIVGYTNAGKSSLMRALTGSDLLVADQLFATLDTTVRALHPETKPRILVIDTVGFIKKLPHDLVASFRSTLAEARDASLLLHVVDGSDPAFREQLRVTLEVLGELDALDAPRQLVLNKADKLGDAERSALLDEFPEAVLLSAKDPTDVERLHAHIVSFFEEDMVDEDLFVPYSRQRVVSAAHEACRVLSETHDEHGTHLRLRAKPEVVSHLRAIAGR